MRIEVFDHPFEAGPPAVFEATHIGAWLLAYYGETPAVRVQVFEGAPSIETEITGNVERLMASDAPVYTVLESPAGVDPFSWAIFAAAAVLAVAAVLLMPKPAMPANVNRTQQSANNSLSDRNNQLRLLQRVEDIYGQVRAIPSLMMPTYSKYRDNRLYEFGYYCISRGYIDASDIRDAETLVSDIVGASAAVYWPFTSPNGGSPVLQIGDPIGDTIVTARRAEEVDGITLRAPNQAQLPASDSYDFVPDAGGDIIRQNNPSPNFNALVDAGDQITVAMIPSSGATSGSATVIGASKTVNLAGIDAIVEPGWTINFSGFANGANNGTRTVVGVSFGSVTLSGGAAMIDESAPSVAANSTGPDLSGSYMVASVGDGEIILSTAAWSAGDLDKFASVQLVGGSEWTGWITVPDAERNQLWANVVAQQGLYKDGGGGPQPVTINFELQTERLDASLSPTGSVDTASGSISGTSSDQYAVTFEHVTPWIGPVRVRMRRSTDHDFGFDGTVIDEIKWQDLYAVTPVPRTEFGNKTTIHTVTKATERATSLRNRQINCMAYRLLPTYDGVEFSGTFDTEGRLASGSIARTSQIADIIAAVSLDPKIGRRSLSDLDINQIYAANQRASAMHPEAGQFQYTFDSDSLSYEETITTIANAAFCLAYRQNGKIRLAFDQAQNESAAIFTHRNKRPKSDTITRKFASDAEYDGVEFVYQDPDTETSETIVLPLNGNYTKLKKFEIAGIRSYAQAWLRANREYYKLIGQRLTLKTDATGEARALLPNARIEVADNTRYETYDGEIVGQVGLEVQLSRPVIFTPSQTHSLVVQRRDGSIQSIPVTLGSQPNRVMLGYIPSEAFVTQYGPDGVRTIFSFAADSARDAMAWMVQELDQSDPQYVGITAINYSASYYQQDNQPIPPKQTIINS